MTMSPQQKAAETVKARRQMAAIVAEQDAMRAELLELRRCVVRLTDKILPAVEELLDECRGVNGKPSKPSLRLVSADETP